jgi:hypothetical protein
MAAEERVCRACGADREASVSTAEVRLPPVDTSPIATSEALETTADVELGTATEVVELSPDDAPEVGVATEHMQLPSVDEAEEGTVAVPLGAMPATPPQRPTEPVPVPEAAPPEPTPATPPAEAPAPAPSPLEQPLKDREPEPAPRGPAPASKASTEKPKPRAASTPPRPQPADTRPARTAGPGSGPGGGGGARGGSSGGRRSALPLALLLVLAVVVLLAVLVVVMVRWLGQAPADAPEPPMLATAVPTPTVDDRPLPTVLPTLASDPTPAAEPTAAPTPAPRIQLAPPPPAGYAPSAQALMGWWSFDEARGAAAADASALAHTATLHAAAWTTGRFGSGVRVSGSGGWVELPSTPQLDGLQAGSYTIAVWFQPIGAPPQPATGEAEQYAIVVKPGYHEGLTYTAEQRFGIQHWVQGNAFMGVFSDGTYSPGAFYHLAGVVDLGNATTSLYVNGELAAVRTWPSGSPAREFGTATWRVGVANPAAPSWQWGARGVVDELLLYSRALSAAEIALLAGP